MGRKEFLCYVVGILTILGSAYGSYLGFITSEFWKGFWMATDTALVIWGAWYMFCRKESPLYIDIHNLDED